MKQFLVLFLPSFIILTAHAQQPSDSRVFADSQKFEAVGRVFARLLPSNNISGISFGSSFIDKKIKSNRKKGHETQFNFCTASLVSERNIMTAAHCATMAMNFKKVGIDVYFKPSSKNEKPIAISYLSKFGNLTEIPLFKDDWALVVLAQPILNIEPLHFLRMSSDKKIPSTNLLSVGYPWKVRDEIHEGFVLFESQCRYLSTIDQSVMLSQDARKRVHGADITNCVVSEMNSGGPILVLQQTDRGAKYRIVGISVSIQKASSFLQNLVSDTVPYLAFHVPSDIILDALR